MSEHAEFQGAGAKPGVEIWRIESLVPQPIPKEDYGKFFDGDCYIVLHTYKRGTANEYNVFFWLGAESSQDEQGAAALKTVELDDSLGGRPVQFRETQGHESNEFLSLFKSSGGVEYLHGGVASGFKSASEEVAKLQVPRLLHLKGRRAVRTKQVECTADSLNNGDVFVLDAPNENVIFQWNGSKANLHEKAKGLEVTSNLKEARPNADIKVIDEGSEPEQFWTILGGQKAVKDASEVESDEAAAKAASTERKLFRVKETEGSINIEEVAQGVLEKSMLASDDSFVVLAGADLFVWVGKDASVAEKRESWKFATHFLKEHNLPPSTNVANVKEGSEPPAFKALFMKWPLEAVDFTKPRTTGNVAQVEDKGFDTSALFERAPAQEEGPVDDGSGKLQIWRVENFDLAPVPEDMYGQFYGGDSYVLLYTYENNGREEYIIYFWLGRESSQDEKGTAALKAKELDDKYNGAPVQVRVVMGKEPSHFLSLFKGTMVVHSGGKASAFKNKQDADSYDVDGISLFHVKGTTATNTRAVQVEEKATSLNSGDAFILRVPSKLYVWFGSACNGEEKNTARKLSDILKGEREVVEVAEGEEEDAFWEALGGKTEYPKEKEAVELGREPRLFHCSNATGRFVAEEVPNFSQDDLLDDDVYILDTYTNLYVWVGQQANESEKQAAVSLGKDYINNINDGRDEDTPILIISQGKEPALFTSNFLGWSDEKAKTFVDPYEAKLAKIREEQAKKEAAEAANEPEPAPETEAETEAAKAIEAVSFTPGETIPYDKLVAGQEFPAGIDATKRETYLSDEEFQTVFGVSRTEFEALPKWKQVQRKKDVKLF